MCARHSAAARRPETRGRSTAALAAAPSAAVARAPSVASWTRPLRQPPAPVARRPGSPLNGLGVVPAAGRNPLVAPAFLEALSTGNWQSRPVERRRISIMQGDARVIEYLNRGLRHELAAINQYW